MASLITLLTDFGTRDGYVGAMTGVLTSICPDARVVTITHEIPAHDVRAGAIAWSTAAPWFPPGTIHLGVVDPGVGSPRRALVVESGGFLFVAPDNGLVTLLVERDPEARFRSITRTELGLDHQHPTFHGRDLFGPVAAHLARGVAPSEIGPEIDDPVRLPIAPPAREGDTILVEVLAVDRFGNVTLNARRDDLERLAGRADPTLSLRPDATVVPWRRTYAETRRGAALFLWGSSGFMELACREASAGVRFGLAPGTTVALGLGDE